MGRAGPGRAESSAWRGHAATALTPLLSHGLQIPPARAGSGLSLAPKLLCRVQGATSSHVPAGAGREVRCVAQMEDSATEERTGIRGIWFLLLVLCCCVTLGLLSALLVLPALLKRCQLWELRTSRRAALTILVSGKREKLKSAKENLGTCTLGFKGRNLHSCLESKSSAG